MQESPKKIRQNFIQSKTSDNSLKGSHVLLCLTYNLTADTVKKTRRTWWSQRAGGRVRHPTDTRHLHLHVGSHQVKLSAFVHMHMMMMTASGFRLKKAIQSSNKHAELDHHDMGIRLKIRVLTYFELLWAEMYVPKLEEWSEKWRGRGCGHCHHLRQTRSCV